VLANTTATLDTVNAVCTGSPPCRGEPGKALAAPPTCAGNSTAPGNPACDLDPSTDGTAACLAGCNPGGCGAWESRPGSCKDKQDQATDAGTVGACLSGPAGHTWFSPCVDSCCDNSIRNYYRSSVQLRGAPGDFTRWRQYDPRHRGWYKQQRRDFLERNVSTGWSSMYEFSTSQALGLSAMAVAAHPATRELLGVFAIDYDVGAISAIINSTLSGAGSWTFAVELGLGRIVALYYRSSILYQNR
jgi:hypothetical protein